MKKKISFILSVLLLLAFWFVGGLDSELPAQPDEIADATGYVEGLTIDSDGRYYSAFDVSLYLHVHGRLPDNYITKDEARELGWEGGSVEKVAPGYAIGGDVFGNREGLLPEEPGRIYYECDVDTKGTDSRGAHRLVYSDDGLIYYTSDHYETFELLYGEE